jgi:hypothetical protein
MHEQPDLTTCGPTSLHSVYHYYQDNISLEQVLKEIDQFDIGGGTLSCTLGRHALERGYDVQLYSYNINIFDPTWFDYEKDQFISVLKKRQLGFKPGSKDNVAISEYIKFLNAGGKLSFEDLSADLLIKILQLGTPILTGLSSTWLYQSAREDVITSDDDAINGSPAGHFVIINGLALSREAMIADPYKQNPLGNDTYYKVSLNRLINAILLGVTSFDGNLLVIRKSNV